MSLGAATGWTVTAALLWQWLASLTVAFRASAQFDLVNLFACQLAAVLLALFLILRVHAPDASIRAVLAFRPAHPLFYPLSFVLGLASILPAHVLFTLILKRFPEPEGTDEIIARIFADASTPKRVAMGLIVIAFGPLLEEVFFRGALFSLLRRRADAIACVVATGVLFGVAHLSPQRMLPIAIVGMGMGLVRSASASLVPSVLMHAAFNAVPFFLMIRPDLGDALDGPSAYPYAAASALLAALLCLLAVRLGRRAPRAA